MLAAEKMKRIAHRVGRAGREQNRRGEQITDPCPTCSGQGRVTQERSLSVNIPAGIEDGKKVLFVGCMRRAQEDPWSNIETRYPEGTLVKGKVTKLAPFGAFIQLESGVEALLHISEMSWEHVTDPAQVCKEGDEVQAKVIKSDSGHRKIRLSLRELQEDPWHKFVEDYSVNEEVEGEITELKDFGAFVRITDEVEGLIHVSEIAEERIGHPSDVLEVGQNIDARIIGINEEKRQVRLSMRKPREVREHRERPPREKRRQEPQAPKEYTTEGGGGALTLREHLEQKEK